MNRAALIEGIVAAGLTECADKVIFCACRGSVA
jgi:hypothetical protein